MRVISLGSGSTGNALLVEAGRHGRTKLLIDAGLPYRTLVERLALLGVSPAQLRAILLTHEHQDHVLALPQLLQQFAIPLVADPLTLSALETDRPAAMAQHPATSGTDEDAQQAQPLVLTGGRRLPLPTGTSCVLDDIEVCSFPVPHDAAAPCGYLLCAGGCRVCLVVDSGEITPPMLAAMRQADLLILEANHDRERLLRGPYAYPLKMRILSASGHLSNEQAAEAILQTWRADGIRWLWLAHLSRINNTPQLALTSVRRQLLAAGAALAQVHISVLPPTLGAIWDSTRLWHDEHWWRLTGEEQTRR